MKLVISHPAPRTFHTVCRRIAHLLRDNLGPRGVALRLRRPYKAPVPTRGMSSYVDARTFIELRSERHLHFSQHLHLALLSHSAPGASVMRVSGVRRVSPAQRAQRQWRRARAWLKPANSVAVPPWTQAVAEAPSGIAPVTEWRATPIRNRRLSNAMTSMNPRAVRVTPLALNIDRASVQTRVPRMLARRRLMGQEHEVATGRAPDRVVALRHRTAGVVRNRAQAAAETQVQAKALQYSPPIRPVSLIYRKTASGAVPQERGMDLMHLAQGEFPLRQANMLPTPALAVTRQSTLPPTATRFDSHMLDGLADDVIRRIDKRARVERERRGL